ncbi:hypothetical protein BJ166DRAFT_543722 [Pestalotiopsis sp. NC0098]|nr:hypothetical protein BJ166DRAFT_543722 [Pestalotiopsis sp. NC0098]
MPFCYFLLDISIDPISIICLLFVCFLLFVSGFRPPSAWLKHPTKWFPHAHRQLHDPNATHIFPYFYQHPAPLSFLWHPPFPPTKRQAGVPMPGQGEKSHLFIVVLLVGDQRFFQILPSILIIYQHELGTRRVFPVLWFPSHFGSALLPSLFPSFFLSFS